MTLEAIYMASDNTVKKFNTRDPYRLLNLMGAITVVSDLYECNGLRGYCAILNRTMYAVINGRLKTYEQRIIAGHEASHLVIHKREIMACPVNVMKEFDIFDTFGNMGKYEWEANAFLADFLVSDEDVLDLVADIEHDYFSIARELYMPPALFAFKLQSMIKRGHNLRNPVGLDSKFLKYDTNRW